MSELKPYQVRMNGWETTMLLSDEDAELHRKLGNLDPEVEPAPPEEKAAPPKRNKARTAPNKS